MKKLLGALFVLVAAGVLAFGVIGSGAWFTDQATSPVTASTGQIVLDLNGDANAAMTLTNVVPGVYGNLKTVKVYNTAGSTVPVKYRFLAQKTGGSSGVWNQVWVKVRHGNCVNVPPDDHNNSKGAVYEGLLKSIDVNSIAHAISASLGINDTHCYTFEFKLADTAGNTLQNQSVNFDVIADATQVENPGWSQAGT